MRKQFITSGGPCLRLEWGHWERRVQGGREGGWSGRWVVGKVGRGEGGGGDWVPLEGLCLVSW